MDDGQRTIDASVVVTVRNEGQSIDELLAALAAQTVRPREIVIVDGGSTDGTVAAIRAWQGHLPIRLIEAPGASISQGRNLGIAAAACDVVAITDAGTRPTPGWLASITARLLEVPAGHEPRPAVVGGWFIADPRTTVEVAMGATVLPTLDEIDPSRFLPSSRSIAFARSAWAAVGGYPEWLDYCEDLVFDLALAGADQARAFVPAALVRFRPRSTLAAFWHQYFRYARGDGKAGLWRRRHVIRYLTYGGAAGALSLGARRGWRGIGLALLALLPGGIAYLWRPYARLLPYAAPMRPRAALMAAALVPVIRLVGDLAKMAGYPVGLRWRARRYGLHRGWAAIQALSGSALASAARPAQGRDGAPAPAQDLLGDAQRR